MCGTVPHLACLCFFYRHRLVYGAHAKCRHFTPGVEGNGSTFSVYKSPPDPSWPDQEELHHNYKTLNHKISRLELQAATLATRHHSRSTTQETHIVPNLVATRPRPLNSNRVSGAPVSTSCLSFPTTLVKGESRVFSTVTVTGFPAGGIHY